MATSQGPGEAQELGINTKAAATSACKELNIKVGLRGETGNKRVKEKQKTPKELTAVTENEKLGVRLLKIR